MIEFEWENITSWEADAEGMAFQFEYGRPDKKPRLIKIYTPYVSIVLLTYVCSFSQILYQTCFISGCSILCSNFLTIQVDTAVRGQTFLLIDLNICIFQFVFMLDCFERVSEERKWAANKPLAASKVSEC